MVPAETEVVSCTLEKNFVLTDHVFFLSQLMNVHERINVKEKTVFNKWIDLETEISWYREESIMTAGLILRLQQGL